MAQLLGYLLFGSISLEINVALSLKFSLISGNCSLAPKDVSIYTKLR